MELQDRIIKPRNSYSLAHKLKVINLYDEMGSSVSRVVESTGINTKSVRRWVSQRDQIIEGVNEQAQRKRLGGAGRRALHPEVEKFLYNWVIEMSNKSSNKESTITYKTIQNVVHQFVKDNSFEQFKISVSWIKSFFLRNNLPLNMIHRTQYTRPFKLSKQHENTTTTIDKPLVLCMKNELNNWFKSTFPTFDKTKSKRNTRHSLACQNSVFSSSEVESNGCNSNDGWQSEGELIINYDYS
jgi:hypothetical protein